VLKCIGFDSDADFNKGPGDTGGAFGQNFGILPPSGTADYTRATRDASVKASGASSLKFTIPANSGSDSSGSYFTNFSSDLSVQFGGNSEFYVQWRQRFSPELLKTFYQDGAGWKQVIVGEGDRPGKTVYSCTQLEIVVHDSWQRGAAEMYHSCGEKDRQYQPLDDQVRFVDYKANQWMTFQIGVKIGTWYRNDGKYHRDSAIRLWIAEAGRPSKLSINI